MSNNRCILIFFLLHSVASAQVDSGRIVIELSKMDVLYAGVQNPLRIALSGAAEKVLLVSAQKGKVVKTEDGYSYYIATPQSFDVLKFYQIDSGDTLLLDERKFRITSFPNPLIAFAGKTCYDREVSAVEAKAAKGVILLPLCSTCDGYSVKTYDFDAEFTINAYSIELTSKTQSTVHKDSGQAFSDDVIATLGELHAGDTVRVFDIRVLSPTGKEITLNEILLRVK